MIGSSTRLPYSTKPTTVIRKTPTAYVRTLNTRRSTTGSSVVSRCQMSAVSVTPLITLSVRIMFDENQSASWPLSSTNCSVPMPTASMPMPQ